MRLAEEPPARINDVAEVPETTPDRNGPDRNGRAAAVTFAIIVVAAPAILVALGRDQWFFLDEWDFLADRRAGSVHDLFRPHNEHWSTLPILVYRAVWNAVGLNSYRPYQFIVIALHLTLGVLMRVVMRRSGVDPWVATAAASLFVLLGSGSQNILWAFQIGYVGSVVFGYVHLVLAVHEGAVDRRDWLGLAAGLAGLMCSGVSVPMVFVVGLAVLIARGWRAAALHTVPLGAIYLTWLFAFGRRGYAERGASPEEFLSFMSGAISATFRGMTQIRGLNLLLGAVLVAGLALTFFDARRAAERRRLAMPCALLVGAFVYLAISAIGRPNMIFTHEANRYVHVTAALTLPAIAVAINAIISRKRILLPIGVALLLLGVPGNLRALSVHGYVDRGSPAWMLTLPRVPVAAVVPRDTQVDGNLAREVTIGWLLDGVASGHVPQTFTRDPSVKASATLNLALRQDTTDVIPSPCAVVVEPMSRRLAAGQRLTFTGGPIVVRATDYPGALGGRTFDPAVGNTLVVRASVPVAITSADSSHPATVCG